MPKKEKLPPGWSKQESKTYPGKFYYFHKATRRTTWLLPTDEEPFQPRKTVNEEESKVIKSSTKESPAKTTRRSLSTKEKKESMVPRVIRQTVNVSNSSRPKKILNVSVLNRNNSSLVADYLSSDEDQHNETKKKKDEDEKLPEKPVTNLPALTDRIKVQMKWKPVGPKILQPSSKLIPKDEQKLKRLNDKIPSHSSKITATKSLKKTVISKKSSAQTEQVSFSSKPLGVDSGSENLEVPQKTDTTKKSSKNKKTTKKITKSSPTTKKQSEKTKSSSKKTCLKQKKKIKNKKSSKDLLQNEPKNCSSNFPLVTAEQFWSSQSAVSEIKDSNLVPVYKENVFSFNNQNTSISNSVFISDGYFQDIEDSSQPMEVDTCPEMVDYIVQLRRDMNNENFNMATGDLTKNFQMDTSNSIDHTMHPQVTYVVLDTNTLLNPGDLSVIKNICDGKYSADNHLPYIIIPWVVMQELDVLKMRNKLKPETADRAQKAIVFLSTYFTKKHPRVIGQTLKEAMQQNEYLVAENNDDKILQCCMQLENKYPNGKVILYSNDVNLCNKTLINGISAFNKSSIRSGLSKLCGTLNKNCDQKINSPPSSPSQESMKVSPPKEIKKCRSNKSRSTKVAPQINLANQIYNKLKAILKRVLGLVLETEMKSAYSELWLKIIKVQPPWELRDILYCFLEHWYAVFGQVYTKRKLMETKYRNLSECFSNNKGFIEELDIFSTKLDDSKLVLEPLLRENPAYKAEVKCSLQSIETLQRICAAVKTGEVDISSNLDQLLEQKDLTSKEKLSKTTNCLVSSMVPKPSFNTEFAMNIALTKFQKVWEIFNSYCQEVERTLQGGASPETCQQVLATLQASIPMMEITYKQFSSCLGFSAADILNEVNMFTILAEQLNAILPHLGCQDNDPLVNYIHLQTLFSNPEKRDLLTNGLSQLEIMIRGLLTYQNHLVGT